MSVTDLDVYDLPATLLRCAAAAVAAFLLVTTAGAGGARRSDVAQDSQAADVRGDTRRDVAIQNVVRVYWSRIGESGGVTHTTCGAHAGCCVLWRMQALTITIRY